MNYLIKFKKGNVFLDIFSQEIPLLILSYFRVAADFVKKVLGFVYKGSVPPSLYVLKDFESLHGITFLTYVS